MAHEQVPGPMPEPMPRRVVAHAGRRSPAVAVDAPPHTARRLRAPPMVLVLLVVALPVFLLADTWCLRATRVAVRLTFTANQMVVSADGQTLTAALGAAPDSVRFDSAAATVREYQIDGTDSTNNFTEDATDLASLLPTPEYQFEAWMRGNASYSSWVDARLVAPGGPSAARQVAAPTSLRPIALPPARQVLVTIALERPEAPASIEVLHAGQLLATVLFDRNDRLLQLTSATAAPVVAYFPEEPWPFVAEMADSLLRIMIWAWVVLMLVLSLAGLYDAVSPRAAGRLARLLRPHGGAPGAPGGVARWRAARTANPATTRPSSAPSLWRRRTSHLDATGWRSAIQRTTMPDRAAILALAAALGFTLFIALAQYHGQPHILDASAYYFQAKIFASGHLAAPVPADLPAFQGPFMVAYQGRWFAQYPPATSALLALGMLARMPWLVEPVLGTAALLGIYLLGRRLFGGPTGLLAVVLGALSPFYAYLAASYLSHTVALCFEVYFLLFVVRFLERLRQRDLVLAGACLGAMFCTRELSAVLCGLVTTGWMLGAHWRRLWRHRLVVIPAALAGLTALGVGLALYLGYTLAQTGNVFLLPRTLFSPADRYGFGVGIGFYGQHTLAAGLVVLDQLLTALLIDLFGWPFYLTLAFLPIALLRRDRASRWDGFFFTLASLLALAQAGYFYHGIFLGPRYLYETLPALLLLTARGITALPVLVSQLAAHCRAWWLRVRPSSPVIAELAPSSLNRGAHGDIRRGARVATVLFVAALLAFNLGFYLPRQLAQHQDFTGLPPYVPVDVAAIYRDPPRNALVLTDNAMVYNYVLSPLNDPLLRGSTLYALAQGPDDISRLIREFPTRTVYLLSLGPRGQVSYLPLAPGSS